MTCSYCRYLNSDDDRRCRRCGRPQYDVYAAATAGALAAVPQAAQSDPSEQPVTGLAKPGGVPRQGKLFPDRAVGNVIPFDGLFESPAPPKPRAATRTGTRAPRRTGFLNDAQSSLEFLQPSAPAPRKLGTTVEAVIDCDAPVAAPMHRACAAAIDGSLITIACGIFFTAFYVLCGEIPGGKAALVIMPAAAILIAMFYGFVWVCAGGRTPGMRALRLSLINFDGYPPDRTSRWLRYLGTCLSYSTVGLGLLWALLDEESLAWHDHISKTFPTFQGPETSFVRRP